MAASLLWIGSATYDVAGAGQQLVRGVLTVPPTSPGTSAPASLLIFLQSNVTHNGSTTGSTYQFGFNPNAGPPSAPIGMGEYLTIAPIAGGTRGLVAPASTTDLTFATIANGGTIDILVNIVAAQMPGLVDHGMIFAAVLDHQHAAPLTDGLWFAATTTSSAGGAGPRSTTYNV